MSVLIGVAKGQQIAKNIGGVDKNPKDVLKGQTSRAGMLIWNQKVVELNEQKAVKIFKECPHIETFKEQGAEPEEVNRLCRDMICWGDYGTFSPFPQVTQEWTTRLADGKSLCCTMTITKKPDSD